MDKLEIIKREVKKLYEDSSEEEMMSWFFENHVEVVADFGKEIAEKVGADVEIVILSALFHDIARCWRTYDEPALMDDSLSKAEKIMGENGFATEAISKVKEAIRSHSCKEAMPSSEEGKALATADGVAHFEKNLFFVMALNRWLIAASNYDEFKDWILEKIERDYNKKIFYEEYREKVKEKYEAIKTVFES